MDQIRVLKRIMRKYGVYKRDQPVTYTVENKLLVNPYTEYDSSYISNQPRPNPAKIDKQIVDGNTQDQTVDIYY